MPAPLVGIAVAAAARLAAKKFAQQGAKKVAQTAAARTRSNSAAAAKAVAPKKTMGPVKVLKPIKSAVNVTKPKTAKKIAMRNATIAYITARAKSGTNPKSSVKIVPTSSSLARDIKNIQATGKTLSAKEGTAAKVGAKKVVTAKPAKVIKINTNPKPAVVKPVRVTTPTAQQSIDAARKALGSTKPDPKALARRITQDKAREMERIRRQGRNTR